MILKHLCKKGIRSVCAYRYDPFASIAYVTPEELGMDEERFSFKSGEWTLSGSKYAAKQKAKGIVIFFHGLFDGRESYLFEISQFVHEGYVVYAYDNTGCALSEGDQIYTFEHTAFDQRAFFSAYRKELSSYELPIIAVGHSWGGFGALIAPLACPELSKVISISGFVNFRQLAFLGVNMKPNRLLERAFSKAVKAIEGERYDIDARSVLGAWKGKALYIQGKEDKVVPLEAGYEALAKAFPPDQGEKIELMLVEGSGHAPHRDPAAEKYVNDVLNAGIMEINAPKDLRIDTSKGLVRNETVWKRIFDFLKE